MPQIIEQLNRFVDFLKASTEIELSAFESPPSDDANQTMTSDMPADVAEFYQQADGFRISWHFKDWAERFSDLPSGEVTVGGHMKLDPLDKLLHVTGFEEEIFAEADIERGYHLNMGFNLDSYLVYGEGQDPTVFVYSHDNCEGDWTQMGFSAFLLVGLAFGFRRWWEEAYLWPAFDGANSSELSPDTLDWMARLRLARLFQIDIAGVDLPGAVEARIHLLYGRFEDARRCFEETDPEGGVQRCDEGQRTYAELNNLVDIHSNCC